MQSRGRRASGSSASPRTYPHAVWLNPVPEPHWCGQSTVMIRKLFADRMYPLTLNGIEAAMKELTR